MKDERQKAVEKLVAEGLKRGLKPGGDACPDSATIAAYFDQALTLRERANVEKHAATCRRCQEAVAALVKLAEHDAPARVGAPAKPRAFAAGRWAWAAPLLLAVVIVGVWRIGELRSRLAAPQPDKVSPTPPSRPAASPEAAAPASTATSQTRTALRQEPSAKPLEKQGPEAGLRKDISTNEKTTEGRDKFGKTPAPVTAPAPPAESASNIATTGGMATPRVRAKLAAATPAPAATNLGTPQGTGAASGGAVAHEEAQGKATPEEPKETSVESAEKKAQVTTGALKTDKVMSSTQQVEVPGAPKNVLGLRPYNKLESSPWKEIQTPKAGTWRVGPGGMLVRLGRHRQWTAVASGVSVDLNALTFYDASEGWIVGQSGTVLHSTDGGKSWAAVTSPTSSDLIQVSATAESSAQVTSRDGSVFTTADGGATWNSATRP